MNIIGVSGQLRMGKDVVSDYLAEKLKYKDNNGQMQNWGRTALALPVKQVFCESFGVHMDFIEEWKVKQEKPPGFEQTVREALQFIGDGFRKIYPTVWLELCFRNIINPSIISDVRYTNELRAVKEHGGINVLIYRPGFLNDDPNGSEAQIRPIIDFFVENGCEGIVDRSQFDVMPEGAELVDFFLRNDGTTKELYAKIYFNLIPYIEETLLI